MKYFLLFLFAGLLFVAGCGGSAERTTRARTEVDIPQAGAPGRANQEIEGAVPEAPQPRKIIYTGQVSVIVDDFDKAQEELIQLAGQFKGYVAGSDLQGSPGNRRTGNWTIRVPADRFTEFMDAVVKLGELQRRQTSSEDITDKYFDTEARLKNHEARQQRLRALYNKAANVDETIRLEEALDKLQGEIDSKKGLLSMWDKQTAYSTVTVTLHERKGYVPPESPAFSTSIGRTFSNSWDALLRFGKGLVLLGVAITPWLPVIALILFTPWLVLRRRRRERLRSNDVVVAEQPPTSDE
jgi:hypothetical protein